jgi:hypothetical protein
MFQLQCRLLPSSVRAAELCLVSRRQLLCNHGPLCSDGHVFSGLLLDGGCGFMLVVRHWHPCGQFRSDGMLLLHRWPILHFFFHSVPRLQFRPISRFHWLYRLQVLRCGHVHELKRRSIMPELPRCEAWARICPELSSHVAFKLCAATVSSSPDSFSSSTQRQGVTVFCMPVQLSQRASSFLSRISAPMC